MHDESLKAYLAPTGLVSEPRGDLTCRGVEFREGAGCGVISRGGGEDVNKAFSRTQV